VRQPQQRRGAPCRAQAAAAAESDTDDAYYANWAALPIQPGAVRRTRRIDAGPGFWLFEQTQARAAAAHAPPEHPLMWASSRARAQGVLDVIVDTRMTVVRLRDGSLFVYSPVAPTRECLRLLRELNAPVKYIVLPTSAVEHKARAALAPGASHAATVARAFTCRWLHMHAARWFLGVRCVKRACLRRARRCSWARLHASFRKRRRVAGCATLPPLRGTDLRCPLLRLCAATHRATPRCTPRLASGRGR
jgi:hypothetical protein